MDLAIRRYDVVLGHRIACRGQPIMPTLEGSPPAVFLRCAVANAWRDVHRSAVGIHDDDDAGQWRPAKLTQQVAEVPGDAVDVEVRVDLAEVRSRDVPIQVLRTANA